MYTDVAMLTISLLTSYSFNFQNTLATFSETLASQLICRFLSLSEVNKLGVISSYRFHSHESVIQKLGSG